MMRYFDNMGARCQLRPLIFTATKREVVTAATMLKTDNHFVTSDYDGEYVCRGRIFVWMLSLQRIGTE
jgi:hypothetical protein